MHFQLGHPFVQIFELILVILLLIIYILLSFVGLVLHEIFQIAIYDHLLPSLLD